MSPDGISGSIRALEATLAAIERRLAHVELALHMVGLTACRQCKRFFRHSEPGVLFDRNGPVCADCVPEWMAQLGPQLAAADRAILERLLTRWLLTYHRGAIVRDFRKLPQSPPAKLRLVVGCEDCEGSGVLSDKRCAYCDGRGTVWVIVLGEAAEAAMESAEGTKSAE